VNRDGNQNTFFGLAVFVGAALLCGFFAALMGSKTAGEIAGALGSFIGGIVGAGGAVIADYLTLATQRKAETVKVAVAVRTEVAALAKYVMGAVEICQHIASGIRQVPVSDASYIIRKLMVEPIVYPAVADRIGLLPHANATTEFYMRLSEAKTIVESMQMAFRQAPAAQLVTPDLAATIADSLITTLQLARGILGDDEADPAERAHFEGWVRGIMVNQIDDCLRSAKVTWPNAESFQVPGL